MKIQKKCLACFLVPVALSSTPVFADWTLNGGESSLYYTTSKAGAITEVNTFHNLSGTIADNGNASFEVSLDSVDTMIELRDERVLDVLFHVSDFLPSTPAAIASIPVDAMVLKNMSPGETIHGDYFTNVSILGVSQDISVELDVTSLGGGDLLIHNIKPLIINAQSFGLDAGVEELRQIANLPSINNNVVVNFTLRYDRN